MLKKTIFHFIIISTGIISLLILMLQFAPLPNKHKNGFKRNWLTGKTIPLNKVSTKAPLQKICGATSSHIFFTVPNPQGIIMFDHQLQNQDTVLYGIPVTKEIVNANSIYVDSPDIYLFANNIQSLFHGKFNDAYIKQIKLGDFIFTRSVLISPERSIVRALNYHQKKQVFQKIDNKTGIIINEADVINQGGGTSGFESDGILKYDSATRRVFYLMHYTNQLYCMDTNLKIIYKVNTIDTTNSNSVSIKELKLKEETRLMPSASRITVNYDFCIGKEYLFIVSGLKADNESIRNFKRNTVIDCYKIKDGSYSGSFYIPNTYEEKAKSIYVWNNLLVALYKSHVHTFHLNI